VDVTRGQGRKRFAEGKKLKVKAEGRWSDERRDEKEVGKMDAKGGYEFYFVVGVRGGGRTKEKKKGECW